ncbi:MAG: anti-sigma F factor [Clostridiales bacterium]|jgi:stage II sporulation protein AB (anti-sigma F factor)|nr:anti-sigma F factor [Clostridiales bacterium]
MEITADKFDNKITITMRAKSQNESFARVAAAAFVAPYDPLLNDLTDIKTAVSEAVTNAIIHGYECNDGLVTLTFCSKDDEMLISVSDDGVGIEDIEKAREPMYTSKPEMERSGMGFTVMETFMDSVDVESAPGRGTTVIMSKKLANRAG